MKFKRIFLAVFCLFCIVSNISAASAISFDAEVLFNSVMVVYTDKGIGSGFAVDENTIITNQHVIEGFTNVSVKLYNNKICSGKVIKSDKDIDLAIIKVDEQLVPLDLDNGEESLSVGEEVYAIGAPMDIPYTMTKGIISAKDRIIGDYKYIQIDASINEGNSGGPLLNEKGKVIGINTMKIKDAEGIGFVIRSSYINDFINNKKIEKSSSSEISDNNSITRDYEDSRYREVVRENEKLKVLVMTLSLLLVFVIIMIVRIGTKYKKLCNFEIDVQEGNWIK